MLGPSPSTSDLRAPRCSSPTVPGGQGQRTDLRSDSVERQVQRCPPTPSSAQAQPFCYLVLTPRQSSLGVLSGYGWGAVAWAQSCRTIRLWGWRHSPPDDAIPTPISLTLAGQLTQKHKLPFLPQSCLAGTGSLLLQPAGAPGIKESLSL